MDYGLPLILNYAIAVMIRCRTGSLNAARIPSKAFFWTKSQRGLLQKCSFGPNRSADCFKSVLLDQIAARISSKAFFWAKSQHGLLQKRSFGPNHSADSFK